MSRIWQGGIAVYIDILITKGENNRTNESVRKRLKKYVEKYGSTYSSIGRDCDFKEKSYYLVSRFARGLNLDENTLQVIDNYLTERGA